MNGPYAAQAVRVPHWNNVDIAGTMRYGGSAHESLLVSTLMTDELLQ
jgi:hypothetical protein